MPKLNKRFILILFIIFFQFSFVTKSDADLNDIDVVGNETFIVQVKKAQELMKNKAPEEFEIIKNYVGLIRQAEHSGMLAYSQPPTYELNDRTAFYSITWCAGTIAHDAYHSKLYNDYKRSIGGAVPDDVWMGQDAEKKCMGFQVEVMKKIGSPEHEIRYLNSLDGTYYDVNKDGRYDEDDYKKRDW